jgi:hypothetical protein
MTKADGLTIFFVSSLGSPRPLRRPLPDRTSHNDNWAAAKPFQFDNDDGFTWLREMLASYRVIVPPDGLVAGRWVVAAPQPRINTRMAWSQRAG